MPDSHWDQDEIDARNRRVFGEGRDLSKSTSSPDLHSDDPGVSVTGNAPGQLEAPIQAEVTKLLQEDGWRPLRTDPVSDRGRGKGFGELGMADYLYIRYGFPNTSYFATALLLWVEFKRSKGGIVSKVQRDWHTKERARGALTLIAGEDFPASVEGFKAWYKASGLQRKKEL